MARPSRPDGLTSLLGRAASRGGPCSLLLLRRALERRLAVALGGAADRDPMRLALLGLRDPDLQHAVLELGRDAVGVDPVGQAQRAREAAERTLDAVPTALTLLML